MTTEIDRQNIIYTARLDGKEEGIEEGTKNTARNFKNLGVDIETIMKATGLSEEEVESL